MADPTVAMAYGTGYVNIKEILKAGIPMVVIGIILTIVIMLTNTKIIPRLKQNPEIICRYKFISTDYSFIFFIYNKKNKIEYKQKFIGGISR